MKPFLWILALFAIMVTLTTGCTENARVRAFGGTGTISLPPGEKLVNVTWKDTDLWYVTRPMRPGETAEKYTFQEKSSIGIVEGTYNIIENGSGPAINVENKIVHEDPGNPYTIK